MFTHGLFIDGFAGGGGASTGIAAAIGREVDIAINHDHLAIAIHKANHPTTEHHCQDIRALWPLAATKLQPVDGAWFSPDCKEHSKAKGGPVKDRHIRTLPWEILPWLKLTQPVVGYVENVEEMVQWGPLDDEGHVIKHLRGKEFKRWIRAIRALGYRVEWRELRACDYGAPTSRKRLYIIMRSDKLRITWPKPTHGHRNCPGVRKGRLLPYRTAAECIDFSIPCPSIFDRARELVDNTKRRIAHGVMRHVVNAAEPFIVPVTHTGSASRVHGTRDPLRTVTTANGGELAFVDATLAPHITKFHSGSVGSDMSDEMPTVTGNGNPARPAGAMPLGLVAGTLAQLQNGERRPGETPRSQDPADTFSTIATDGKFAAVGATLIQTAHSYADKKGPRPRRGVLDIKDTAPTSTTSSTAAVVQADMVEAAFLDRQFGKSKGAAANSPAPAIMAGGGGKSAQVSAFMTQFHNSNTRGGRGDPRDPAKAVLASGMHQGLVCANMAQFNNNPDGSVNVGHPVEKPVSPIVTRGPVQGVVETTLLPHDALPPEMMERAEMVAAFLVKFYGTGLSAPLDKSFDTVTTLPRYAVVTVTINAITYVIVDIGLRMLTPRELANAQGFPRDYILDPIVRQFIRGKWIDKRLSKAAQIRMIGNSVCPDVARALVAANQPGADRTWRGVVSDMRMAA